MFTLVWCSAMFTQNLNHTRQNKAGADGGIFGFSITILFHFELILLAFKALNSSGTLYRLHFQSNFRNVKGLHYKMLKCGDAAFYFRRFERSGKIGKCSQMLVSSQNKISEEEIWGGAKWTHDTNIWWYKFPKVGTYLRCHLKNLLFGLVYSI